MIQSIILQPLRNGAFIQFIIDFFSIVDKNDPDTLKVRSQYDALRNMADELENLFKLTQARLITAEIEALDLRRDRAIIGISNEVNDGIDPWSSEIAQANQSITNYNTLLARCGEATKPYRKKHLWPLKMPQVKLPKFRRR